MDTKVFQKISYGLFILTAHKDGKDNGCIINTAVQLATNPLNISFAANKANYTCKMIQETKKCTISIINEEADFELFKAFGFCSGIDTDKFKTFDDYKRTSNGTLAITKGTNSYICADIEKQIDLGSHILFICKPNETEILNNVPSATYAYYFENIKPKPQTSTNQNVYRCIICGYEYKGDILPDDFICPLCKHPASDFVKL